MPLIEPEDREALGCGALIAALFLLAVVVAIVASLVLAR